MDKKILTNEIKKYILSEWDMDFVGVCPSEALESEPEANRPSSMLPCAKSIVVYGKRLLNGAIQAQFRRLEDGNDNAESIYSTFGQELVPNFQMLFATYHITNYLERTWGASTQPLSCGPMQNGCSKNTELPMFAGPYLGGIPLNIPKAAVAAGLAQPAWSNYVVTKEFGPRVIWGAVIVDLDMEYDKPDDGERLCDPDKCHVCSDECPMHALPKKGEKDAKIWIINGKEYEVSDHNVNACTVAALGMRDEFAGRKKVGDLIAKDNMNPTDADIAKAMKERPLSDTNMDHYPKFFCSKCLVYCPIGNWKKTFIDTKLSKK